MRRNTYTCCEYACGEYGEEYEVVATDPKDAAESFVSLHVDYESDCEVAVCVKWSEEERMFNVRVRIEHTFTAEGM